MSAICGIPQKTDSDMEFSMPGVYEGVPLGSITVEGEEGRRGRKREVEMNIRLTTGLAKPTRSYRVGMIFRIVLSWSKKCVCVQSLSRV